MTEKRNDDTHRVYVLNAAIGKCQSACVNLRAPQSIELLKQARNDLSILIRSIEEQNAADGRRLLGVTP